eukprot:CAMPEP_0194706504 /NCGR_PEP_ID=MMETSP0295-20121207/29598_1 /TAXON_ID=39354 /ORGANISM="Heterosigma akashiwo, Strain CCMP2393" /LENGTH=134 /DNA_ID=CAMNT_0039602453 /DNA_START=277 /DNA_END=681 /DNA_ORIENTATION=+
MAMALNCAGRLPAPQRPQPQRRGHRRRGSLLLELPEPVAGLLGDPKVEDDLEAGPVVLRVLVEGRMHHGPVNIWNLAVDHEDRRHIRVATFNSVRAGAQRAGHQPALAALRGAEGVDPQRLVERRPRGSFLAGA